MKNIKTILSKSIFSVLILGLLFTTYGCGKLLNALDEDNADQPVHPSSKTEYKISGVVKDKTNKVVINADVYLYKVDSSSIFKSTKTNTDGYFCFEELPTGNFNVITAKSDNEKALIKDILINEDIIEKLLGVISLQQTGTISGKATLADSTDHLGIDAYIPGTSFTAKTDSQGNYTIQYIPPGTYAVVYEKTGYVRQFISNNIIESQENTDVAPTKLYKQVNKGTISGTATLQGKADYSSILVKLKDTTYSTLTTSSGSYLFHVPIGNYNGLIFEKEDFNIASNPNTITLIQGGVYKPATVELKAAANSLYGKATIKNQTDYSNITIQLVGTSFSTKTDIQGNYSIDHIPIGTYKLKASYSQSADININNIQIKAGNATSISNIYIQPCGNISGTIILQGISDYSGVQVALDNTSYTTYTDKSGEFLLSNVMVGNYMLTASKLGFDSYSTSNISVSINKTTETNSTELQDTTPPLTTDNADTNWHNQNITITLTSSDQGSGVNNIYYKIETQDPNNQESQVIYNINDNGQPTITSEGIYTITYWAIDNLGNNEESHTVSNINLDKTAQIFSASENTNNITKKAGDIIHFTVDTQEANGTIKINIGSEITNIALYDNGTNGDSTANDGIYERNYEIQENSNIQNSSFTIYFTDKANNLVSAEITSSLITIDTTAPSTPTGLSLDPSSGQISLDWDNNSESDLLGYNIYRNKNELNPEDYQKINSEPITQSKYIDISVTNGIRYYYVVTAIDKAHNEYPLHIAYYPFSGIPNTMPGTYVEGIISSDTTWTKANSPYLISNTIQIPNSITLTIEPGTQIFRDVDDTGLLVKGSLVANGTSTDRITFSFLKNTINDYSSFIVFSDTNLANSQLSYINFEHTNDSKENSIMIEKNNTNCLEISNSQIFSTITVTDNTDNIRLIINNSTISNTIIQVAGPLKINNSIISNTRIERPIYPYYYSYPYCSVDIHESIVNNAVIEDASYQITKSNISDTSFQEHSKLKLEESTLYNCSIQNSRYRSPLEIITSTLNNCSIIAATSKVDMYNSSFSYTGDKGIIMAEGTIDHSVISGPNSGTGLYATFVTSHGITISNSIIQNNSVGIELHAHLEAPFLIENCNLINNNYNLKNTCGLNPNTSNNYWGSNEEANIQSKIYDSNDDISVGTITYTPFLTEPNSKAGTINQ
jgi:hypothetical protein